VVLSEHDVVQPDILLIQERHKSIIKAQNVKGSPDICIEILSPATLDRDLEAKRRIYLRYGVLEYWIVDPEAKTIEVLQAGREAFEAYRIFKEGIPLSTPLVPDLELDLSKVF
ncbi:MAG: Uma2 family endonuclease, partial [Armatimonadetes bacterium]|nr:Uma2 family endonuclease [Armatimonadota bacterium]